MGGKESFTHLKRKVVVEEFLALPVSAKYRLVGFFFFLSNIELFTTSTYSPEEEKIKISFSFRYKE